MSKGLKMPKLQGYADGTFSTPESNGWHIMINRKGRMPPGLTTLLKHDESNAELIILTPALGAEIIAVHVLLVAPPYGIFQYGEDRIEVKDNDVEGLLTATVNNSLKEIRKGYDLYLMECI